MIRFRSAVERARSSFFFVPGVFLLGAVLLAAALLVLDARIDSERLPPVLRMSGATARVVLSTVAGATITVTATVFSIAVVAVQLASSQFSPRTLRNFMRDRVQQTVMGITIGTFGFCLVALRAVDAPIGGEVDVPQLTVSAALVFAAASAIAILVFIDHTARSMQVGRIVRRVTDESRTLLERKFSKADAGNPVAAPPAIDGRDFVVRSAATGWVQQIDDAQLVDSLPAQTAVTLAVAPGSFARSGSVLATVGRAVGGPSEDAASEEQLGDRVRSAVAVGRDRTMQQDLTFGLLQLSDIAVRALSPGVNDPSTAVSVVEHLGVVLHELTRRDLTPRVVAGDRCWVVRAADPTFEDYVTGAVSEIRRAARRDVRVTVALLRVLADLAATAAEDEHRADRAAVFATQARLVGEGFDREGLPAADLAELDDATAWARAAAEER